MSPEGQRLPHQRQEMKRLILEAGQEVTIRVLAVPPSSDIGNLHPKKKEPESYSLIRRLTVEQGPRLFESISGDIDSEYGVYPDESQPMIDAITARRRDGVSDEDMLQVIREEIAAFHIGADRSHITRLATGMMSQINAYEAKHMSEEVTV